MKSNLTHIHSRKRFGGFTPQISESVQIGVIIHLLTIIIKTGRYLPVISISLTGMNVVLAVNDYLANNTGYAILNSMFVISGVVFLAQTQMMNRTTTHTNQPFRCNHNNNK